MAEQAHIHELVREVLQTLDIPTENGQAQEQEIPEGENVQRLYLLTKEELEQLVNPKLQPTVIEADSTIPPDTTTEAELDEYEITHTPTQPLPPLTEQGEEQEREESTPPPGQKRRRVKLSYVLIPLLLVGMLTAGTLDYLFVLPLTATASVTIVPSAKSLHQVLSLPIATNGRAGVQGRILEQVSLSKSTTVAATGHGHDDARRATGEIVFYNTDITPVSIPAGITFTVNSIDIVTSDAVTLPAAKPPIDSQAVSYAHATQAGSQGNIPASTIYTRCCSASVIATNITPFIGGRDARDYSYVQSSDIDNAATTMLPPLTQNATKALYKELRTGESLVPPLCTPRTTADHEPGEEATEVHVSLVQACKSIAYNMTSLQNVATTLLAQSQHLDHYRQIGTIELAIIKATHDKATARITVNVSGTWVYNFSQNDLHHLKRMIAGKSVKNAQALLQQQSGIDQVTIHLHRLDFKNLLPTNPQHITLQFFYVVS